MSITPPASPTPHDFAEKVVFAIEAIDRVRMVTALLHTDHEKRMIGKAAFLFIDSGIAHLRRLNNLVAGGKTLKASLNATATDYESNFAAVRDRLTAHRQEQPPLDELRDWRNIQDDYLAYLRSDIVDLYELIRQRDQGLPVLTNVANLTGARSQALTDATRPPDGYFIDMSAQGMASGYTTTAMMSGPAERGQDVLAVADTLRVLSQMNRALHPAVEWGRLTRALYAGEAIVLFDIVYGDENPDPSHRIPAFVDLLPALGKNADTAIATLRDAETACPVGARDRGLRNRICAHIDDSLPLSSLLALIDGHDWGRLYQAVEETLSAFRSACSSSIALRPLLIHRRVMVGIIGVESSDPAPDYDSSS